VAGRLSVPITSTWRLLGCSSTSSRSRC
jgi:hypothetical protein